MRTIKTYMFFVIFPVIIMLPGLVLLTSCEEETGWSMPEEKINTVIVDGILTNEFKYQKIRLTKPFTDLNGNGIPVSGAFVVVTTDNQPYLFEESPDEPGSYYTADQVAASISENYHLKVEYEGKIYRAHARMIPVSNTGKPTWQYDDSKGLYKINWNQGNYNPFEQAMYEAIISWDHLVGSSYPDSITTVKMMYYTLNTIDVSYIIIPQDKDEVYFPANSKAIVKKYSITDDYGAFLRALLAETEWQGSLFEEARGNIPTNISNGGLGYFSACSVIVDTLLVGQ